MRRLTVTALIVGGATVAVAASGEHGLSQKAVEIGRPFGFPITNSMQQVPGGTQNFLECLVEENDLSSSKIALVYG